MNQRTRIFRLFPESLTYFPYDARCGNADSIKLYLDSVKHGSINSIALEPKSSQNFIVALILHQRSFGRLEIALRAVLGKNYFKIIRPKTNNLFNRECRLTNNSSPDYLVK